MTDRVVFREYEKPEGVDLADYWKIEQLWGGYETDTLYVLHESDTAAIVGQMLLDQYSVRVTWKKPSSTVQLFGEQR